MMENNPMENERLENVSAETTEAQCSENNSAEAIETTASENCVSETTETTASETISAENSETTASEPHSENVVCFPEAVSEDSDEEDDEDDAPRFLNRKKIMAICMAICCLAIIAAGSLAYFTAEETAYNVITTGSVEMKLVEQKKDGTPFEDVSGVMPGQTVDKIVFLRNDGTSPFYARISLETSVTGKDGALDFDRYISLDLNEDDWTYHDGYYYYNRALKPGEQTEPLFTKVSFANKMDNTYLSARVEIDVNAQAVQSANNGSDPLKAAGWE